MRRLWLCLSAVALITGFIATPPASAQQSVTFYVGGFTPRADDARVADDVLFKNGNFLNAGASDRPLSAKDFNFATFGGEWLVGLGNFFDAGIGVGFYQNTVTAAYARFMNANGSLVQQDLKLRIVPVTATVRFLPLGHHAPIQPYVGGGVGIFSWRYSESGEFVANDNSIFRDTFAASGTNAGPVLLGGATVPIGHVGVGGEIRYQKATGDLPVAKDFAGTKIDLGGFNYLFVVNVRF